MSRIRTIKPEFPHSESMGAVSREARLCFIMLWTLADDSGRLRGNSRMLASLLYPYDDDAPELIESWLSELECKDCIVRYEVNGSKYLQISNWLNHQKIDKPSRSKLPGIDEGSRILANPRECSSEDQDQDQDHNIVPTVLVDLPSTTRADPIPYKAIIETYNEICVPKGRPAARRNNSKRQARIRSLWNESSAVRSLEWWTQYFSQAMKVDHIVKGFTGRDGRHWNGADLDYLLQDKVITKIVEGSYDTAQR
jgi:hypothetical protein